MVQKDQQRINFQFASKASYIYTFQLKQNISEIWIKNVNAFKIEARYARLKI